MSWNRRLHPLLLIVATAYLTYSELFAAPGGSGFLSGVALGVLWVLAVVAWSGREGGT